MLPLDGLFVPLIYNGPETIADLWASPVHLHRAAVKVGTGRVIRTRPQFPTWGLLMEFELLTDVMDTEAFTEIADLAGRAEGLGDGRRIGYGRFSATVKAA
jgi:hypothetical protein